MSLWDPANVPPYPPPRHTRDEPEVSARLRRAPENGGAAPDYDAFGLVRYHYLANTWRTNRRPTATTACTASR